MTCNATRGFRGVKDASFGADSGAVGADPVFAVDLDGVCADYESGLRDFVATARGVDTSALPPTCDWDPTRWGWGFATRGDYLEAHGRAVDAGLFARLPVIDGAPAALGALAAGGARICIVTHRLILPGQHRRVGADTLAWLDCHRIPYWDLCFLRNKASLAEADSTFIDDSPDNISAIRAAGGRAVVFDQAYNRHLPGPRLNGWNRAESLLGACASETADVTGRG